jgi:hypothetical protein
VADDYASMSDVAHVSRMEGAPGDPSGGGAGAGYMHMGRRRKETAAPKRRGAPVEMHLSDEAMAYLRRLEAENGVDEEDSGNGQPQPRGA